MEVRQYREAKGYTQQQVADMLGIDRSTYTSKELGRRGFSAEELLLLEDILGASISELFKEIKAKLIKDKLMKK